MPEGVKNASPRLAVYSVWETLLQATEHGAVLGS